MVELGRRRDSAHGRSQGNLPPPRSLGLGRADRRIHRTSRAVRRVPGRRADRLRRASGASAVVWKPALSQRGRHGDDV